MPIMHGPAFNDSGEIVEREVPEVDVKAYVDAGYTLGPKPVAEVPEAEPVDDNADKKGSAKKR
jgi:hypothetical protein